ncbi:hypothetical protein ETB97_012134 [Aspergillus alliaceus]|uniref:Aminotransferase class V domain-containing protein n=1 Tax=Petromyces alliaceus TaxID=209559 RepID=A0A8H6A6W6_PETAA|nr:hypothetical protein ETB97_012134 [Aspergillus burnettii]
MSASTRTNSLKPGQYANNSPEIRYYNDDNLNDMENKKTRLIAVSYVSYLNSPQVNLSHYPQLASLVRAILIVDFTQAAGYAPIDASVADSAFLACYKWLLGTTAAAITYWNQTRMPDSSPATGG